MSEKLTSTSSVMEGRGAYNKHVKLPALCLSNRHGAHRCTTGICVFVKSPTFRETIVRFWWIAVAASKPQERNGPAARCQIGPIEE